MAVVFDFGYTLVNEDRAWKDAAAALGRSDSVFFAALGAVIERRQRHRDVFELLGADRQPSLGPFEPGDFYDDALPSLRAAKQKGHVVGIAGNFSREIERFLSEHAEVDFVASSEGWGVEKPDPAFFSRIAGEVGRPPEEVMYVGDRIDNDVLPAAKAGMASFWVLRGPWAAVQLGWPEAEAVRARVIDLAELPL